MASSAAFAEVAKLPPLQKADARGQRLFDNAVKLQRRYAGKAGHPAEPYRSILMELSDYHDGDEAEFLSEDGEGRRAGPIAVGPWAQREMAREQLKEGAYARAVVEFRELASHYAGRFVAEAAEGARAFSEPVEAAALRGEIQALLQSLSAEQAKGAVKAVESQISALQAGYGSLPCPCQEGHCGSNSRFALEALWRALAMDGTPAKAAKKISLNFLKNERDEALKGEALEALERGSLKLDAGKP